MAKGKSFVLFFKGLPNVKQQKKLHHIMNIKFGQLMDNTHHTLYLAFLNLDYDDAFFIHQVQGVKGETAHKGLSADARSASLSRLLKGFDIDRMLSDEEAEFYVDIRLEFQCPGFVCLWRWEALRYLMDWAFYDDTVQEERNRLYDIMEESIDITALLRRYAGFRLEVPKLLAETSGIAYMQVYCTEKNAHYTFGQGQFDPISPSEFGPGKKSGVQRMAAVLKAFREVNRNPPPTSCRMEMRVCFTPGTKDRFPSFDDNLVETAATGLPCVLWW
jgi:hypothetical protein